MKSSVIRHLFLAVVLALGIGGSALAVSPPIYLSDLPGDTVQAFGITGNGTTDERARLAALPSGRRYFFRSGTYRVSSSLSLNPQAEWHFSPGALIKPDSGVTVILPPSASPGLFKIIDLSAGGKVTFSGGGPLRPEWWGAAGNNSTDDRAAIQAAIDSTTGPALIGYSKSSYYIGNTATGLVINRAGVVFVGAGSYSNGPSTPTSIIRYAGSGAALKINVSSTNYVDGVVIKDMAFHGSEAINGPKQGARGIVVGNATAAIKSAQIILDNVFLTGFQNEGLNCTSSQLSQYYNVNASYNGVGVLFDYTAAGGNTVNHFSGLKCRFNSGEGFYVRSHAAVLNVDGLISEGNGKEGIKIDNPGNTNFHNISINHYESELNNQAAGRQSGQFDININMGTGRYITDLSINDVYITTAGPSHPSGNRGIYVNNWFPGNTIIQGVHLITGSNVAEGAPTYQSAAVTGSYGTLTGNGWFKLSGSRDRSYWTIDATADVQISSREGLDLIDGSATDTIADKIRMGMNYIWFDNAGKLRTGTTAPTTTASRDTTGSVVGALSNPTGTDRFTIERTDSTYSLKVLRTGVGGVGYSIGDTAYIAGGNLLIKDEPLQTATIWQNKDGAQALFLDSLNKRLGAGLASGTPKSTLESGGSFGAKTKTITASDSPYTAGDEYTILVNATDGPVSITVPASNTITGREYRVKKIDSTANVVTVNRSGADTFDGATSKTITGQYHVLMFTVAAGLHLWKQGAP